MKRILFLFLPILLISFFFYSDFKKPNNTQKQPSIVHEQLKRIYKLGKVQNAKIAKLKKNKQDKTLEVIRELEGNDQFPNIRVSENWSVSNQEIFRKTTEEISDYLTEDSNDVKLESFYAMHTDRILVKLKPFKKNQLQSDLSFLGAKISKKLNESYFLVSLDKEEEYDSIRKFLDQHDSVAFSEPDFIVYTNIVPDDSRFGELWGLNQASDIDIDAPEAWELSTGSKDVIVGVIDTGIDLSHPDLADNIWTNNGEIPGNGLDDDGNGYIDDYYGWDFINNDNDPTDDHNHGTHCAGTIGAKGNDGFGVVGVNWNVSLAALKFLSASGHGSTSGAIEAVLYAEKMGFHITSNSWGGGGFSQGLKDAIDATGDKNSIFVAAAGNDGFNNDLSPHYPSSYNSDNVISVAASDQNENVAYFSNYGRNTVDIFAPGVDILSTVVGNGHKSFNGTSMATPHVAGVCALMKSLAPNMGAVELKQRLLDAVDPVSNFQNKCVSGGRLNAEKALLFTGPYVVIKNVSFSDNVQGNSRINDIFSPGEKINFTFELSNIGSEASGPLSIQVINSNSELTFNPASINVNDLLPGDDSTTINLSIDIDSLASAPMDYNFSILVDNASTQWNSSFVLDVFNSSIVSGFVRKKADNTPIEGAVVTYKGPREGVVHSAQDGSFTFEAINGQHNITVEKDGYAFAEQNHTIQEDTSGLEFLLGLPETVLNKTSIDVTLDPSVTHDETFQISNNGNVDLEFNLTSSSSSPKISFSPQNGVIAPGSSLSVTATINTESMHANTYSSNIEINTNHPVNPQTLLPLNLTILSKSKLFISEANLDFGKVFLEVPKVRKFTLTNKGNRNIDIASYAISNNSFTLSTPLTYVPEGLYLQLSPFQSITLTCICDPQGSDLNGTLSFQHNSDLENHSEVSLVAEIRAPVHVLNRPVALSGMTAPNSDKGTVFSSVEAPNINDNGELTFHAYSVSGEYANPGGGRESIWKYKDGQLLLLGRVPDVVPGTDGLSYKSGGWGLSGWLAEDGSVMSKAYLSNMEKWGPFTTAYDPNTGQSILISRDNQPFSALHYYLKPTEHEGIFEANFSYVVEAFKTATHNFSPNGIPSLIMHYAGTLESGLNADNDATLWHDNQIVARESDLVPGLNFGERYDEIGFKNLRSNKDGELFVNLFLKGPEVNSTNDSAMFIIRQGQEPEILYRKGEPSPIGNAYIDWTYIHSAKTGQHVIRMLLSGEDIDGSNDSALFLKDGENLQLIAREGDHAPGLGPEYVFYNDGLISYDRYFMQAISVNDYNDFTFRGVARNTETGEGVEGIWAYIDGELIKVAAEGEFVPGVSETFDLFKDPTINNNKDIVFISDILGVSNKVTLWLYREGQIIKLLKEADNFEADGLSRPVKRFGFAGNFRDGGGSHGKGLNNRGDVAVSIEFDDYKYGVYVLNTYESKVFAGYDKEILLPENTVVFSAAVAAEDAQNVQWEKVSGPAGVSFDDPQNPNTQVSFSTDGVFVLKLSATVEGVVFTDEVEVTVLRNSPPVLSVVGDTLISSGVLSANVGATASDDGLPDNTLTVLWEKVSGPGDVTFADANALTTQATVSISGDYVVKVTVSDGEFAVSEEVEIKETEVTVLSDSTLPQYGYLGEKMATEGNILAASAKDSVYVFEEANGIWAQTAKISGIHGFGSDIAIYQGQIIIGASGVEYGGDSSSGQIYVYGKVEGSWQVVQELNSTHQSWGSFLGSKFDLENGKLAAYVDGDTPGLLIFTKQNGTWQETDFILYRDYSQYLNPPTDIEIDGDYIFLGAGTYSRRVDIFEFKEDAWNYATLDYPDYYGGIGFGYYVEADNGSLLISHGDKTYIYKKNIFGEWEVRQTLEDTVSGFTIKGNTILGKTDGGVKEISWKGDSWSLDYVLPPGLEAPNSYYAQEVEIGDKYYFVADKQANNEKGLIYIYEREDRISIISQISPVLTLNHTSSGVELNWSDPFEDELSFNVERSLNDGHWEALATTPANSTFHLDNSVTSGSKYSYRVRAELSGGSSSWSQPLSLNYTSNIPSSVTVHTPIEPVILQNGAVLSVDIIDADSTEFTKNWTLIRGPGEATFSEMGEQTKADFTELGLYTIQLEVNDGHSSVYEIFEIEVKSDINTGLLVYHNFNSEEAREADYSGFNRDLDQNNFGLTQGIDGLAADITTIAPSNNEGNQDIYGEECSVSLWVKLSTMDVNQNIFRFGSLRCLIYSTGEFSFDSVDISHLTFGHANVGQWTHLVITVNDRDDVELYINGQYVGKDYNAAGHHYYDLVYTIGGYSSTSDPTDKAIDEFRFYDRVLSQEDVLRIYAFDQDQGPTIIAPVQDQHLTMNQEETVIDLSTVFDDIDSSGTLEFQVQSNSNPALLSATVSGNQLTIIPQSDQVGKTQVKIRAISQGKAVDNQFSVYVTNPAYPVGAIEIGSVEDVFKTSWKRVNLRRQYHSMIVVATPEYSSSEIPVIARIRNSNGNSFEIKVDRMDGFSTPLPSGYKINYMVVEEGIYNIAEHGIKMEAGFAPVTVSQKDTLEPGLPLNLLNSYSAPLVFGQSSGYPVDFPAVFWTSASNIENPPSNGDILIGGHSSNFRSTYNSYIDMNYIVIESGSGSIGATDFTAGSLNASSLLDGGSLVPANLDLNGIVASQAGLSDRTWSVIDGENLGIDKGLFKPSERPNDGAVSSFFAFKDQIIKINIPTDINASRGQTSFEIDIPSAFTNMFYSEDVSVSIEDQDLSLFNASVVGDKVIVNFTGFAGNGELRLRLSTHDIEREIVFNVNISGREDIFEHGLITGISTESWLTVPTAFAYNSMVPIATQIHTDGLPPIALRIRNVGANSFEVKAVRVDKLTDPVNNINATWLAVEEGVYTLENDGIKMEAKKFLSSHTDRKNNFQGELRNYSNTYIKPNVYGQVISANDTGWSVFYAQGSSRTSPPDSANLRVGKHIAEDPSTARVAETVGYLVIEEGVYRDGFYEIHSKLGTDTIRGISNGEINYSLAKNLETVILTQAGMDGSDGSWATLRNLGSANLSLGLFVTEDQLSDNEMSHTTEQIAYLGFSHVLPEIDADLNLTLNEGAEDVYINLDDLINYPDVSSLSYNAFSSDDNKVNVSIENRRLKLSFIPGAVGNVTINFSAVDGDYALNSSFDVTLNSLGLFEKGVSKANTETWTVVATEKAFNSMVVVTTPVYQSGPPLVTRIRNITKNSFEVLMQRADGQVDPVNDVDFTWFAVEEGTYTEAEHGVNMEAVKFSSTATSSKGSYTGQALSYTNSFSNPVVFGQVSSFNDSNWSVFFSNGGSEGTPANASTINVGKHVGEDSLKTRADEELCVVVIEQGTFEDVRFSIDAQLGADKIDGYQNSGAVYALFNISDIDAVVATQAAMDGGDGSWSILMSGFKPDVNGNITIGADEDQLGDSERKHTTEQVGTISFSDKK